MNNSRPDLEMMDAFDSSFGWLSRMNSEVLLSLFRTLEAPPHEEMNGEYAARLLQQTSSTRGALGQIAVNNPLLPGRWLCKAFRPVTENRGRGYNLFHHFGRPVQRYPMQTMIALSRYDGKPAFQLVYRAYHSFCGVIHMVDEVRYLEQGVYLGIGTCGFTEAQQMVPRPFLLTGPVSTYRRDIGVERNSFVLRDEIPALRKEEAGMVM